MSRGKSSSVKEDLAAKYRIVAGDGHKKQHGKREHKVGARGQQSQTRELRCFRWNVRAIGSVFFCPPDKFLLDAPDDAPDVQHHEPAKSSTNANGQQPVALPSVRVELEVMPGCGHDDHGHDGSEDNSFFQELWWRHQQCHLDDEDGRPNPKKCSDGEAAAFLCVVSVGGDDHHPVPDAGQHCHHGSPAKPPQCPRHQQRHYFASGGGINFFQERRVDQNKEIKKAHPGNAGAEMDPAQYKLEMRRYTSGKYNVRRIHQPQRVHSASVFLMVSSRTTLTRFALPELPLCTPPLPACRLWRQWRRAHSGSHLWQPVCRGPGSMRQPCSAERVPRPESPDKQCGLRRALSLPSWDSRR